MATQCVKTTVRWEDDDGNILGAVRENEIEFPSYNRKRFMRLDIIDLICELHKENQITRPMKSFNDFVIGSFNVDKIVMIKSRTHGSYINMKDGELKQFIYDRVIEFLH